MPVTFDDLLIAKLLNEYRLVGAGMLRAALRSLDRAPDDSNLVEELRRSGVHIADNRLEQVERRMLHYKFMMSETLCADVIGKGGFSTPDHLKLARQAQREEGYRRRLVDILVAGGGLDPANVAPIDTQLNQRVTTHLTGLIDQYRKTDFEGVSRPLTKSSPKETSPKLGAVGASIPKLQVRNVPVQPTPTPSAPPSPTTTPVVPLTVPPSPVTTPPPAPTPTPTTAETNATEVFTTPLPLPTAPPPSSSAPPPAASAPTPAAPADMFDGLPPAAPAGSITPTGAIPVKHDITRTARIRLPAPSAEELLNAEDPKGLVIGGRFRVDGKLGEGGMGVVFLAHDEDDRACAVKVIRNAKQHYEAVERFKREILATSFFDHENVVEIYDAGEFGDVGYFMAMEFIEGAELRDLIREHKRIELRRAIVISKQLLSCLQAAHDARIVHRDLKPENVMIAQRNGGDFVKLMDFGIARVMDNEDFQDQIFVTMAGGVSGTPAYMAPESVSGEQPTERTDVYACGLILFEMLAGKLPFEAKTARAYLAAHLAKPPMTLAQVAPDLQTPPALQQILDRMFVKKPAERIASCQEVIDWLEQQVEPALV